MINEAISNDVITINEAEYKIGDFITVLGYGPPGHTRVIRIDKIEKPHLTFLCEYEGDKAVFKINSTYVLGLATKSMIEEEYKFRNETKLSSVFMDRSHNDDEEKTELITYAWGTENEVETLSLKTPVLIRSDMFIVKENGKYTLALEDDDPWHDGAMADHLNIFYVDYMNILMKYNGKPQCNLLEYDENDINHSTDTFFDDYNDCMNCLKYLVSLMKGSNWTEC